MDNSELQIRTDEDLDKFITKEEPLYSELSVDDYLKENRGDR